MCDELSISLRAALRESRAFCALAEGEISPLPDTGLAHAHFRLGDSGLLARIPKQSQMNLGAGENLRYQQACFARAAPAGHSPALHGILPPSSHLPRGGLIVDHIDGRPPRLPRDMAALADALAAIHALPLPAQAARAPLLAPADPLQAVVAEVSAQAAFLPRAGLAAAALTQIEKTFAMVQDALRHAGNGQPCLVAFDAHPGNFLLRNDGRAVLVDLEKARYGAPPLDLAHASLYTSTSWDMHIRADLDDREVVAFYRRWMCRVPPRLAQSWRALLLPLRALMWLWSVTWCAKWRVLSDRRSTGSGDGEDWSRDNSSDALVDHVRGRVDHYLEPAVMERCRDWAPGRPLARWADAGAG